MPNNKKPLTDEQILEAEKAEAKKKQEQEAMAGKSNEDKKKAELAKKFGIKLEDIEHVKLDNGKEFFKLVDPKDQSVVMYENVKYNTSLESQYASIQQELSDAQSLDESKNAREVHKKEAKDKLEVTLIPIQEFKSNRFKYLPMLRRRISSVDEGKIKAILALDQNSKVLNLKYINIENAFGIDEKNNVITAEFDYANNKAHIKNAETIVYDKENTDVAEVDLDIEISDAEFEKAVEGFDFEDDNLVINNASNISIAGETVTVDQVKSMYTMPETIERVATTKRQATIYHGLVNALVRKLDARKNNTLNNSKKKVLTNNTKPGMPAA
jgi:hypothetical protein